MREQCKATGRHCKLSVCEGNGSAVVDCKGSSVKSCVCTHVTLARGGGGVWFCGFCNRFGVFGWSVLDSILSPRLRVIDGREGG